MFMQICSYVLCRSSCWNVSAALAFRNSLGSVDQAKTVISILSRAPMMIEEKTETRSNIPRLLHISSKKECGMIEVLRKPE